MKFACLLIALVAFVVGGARAQTVESDLVGIGVAPEVASYLADVLPGSTVAMQVGPTGSSFTSAGNSVLKSGRDYLGAFQPLVELKNRQSLSGFSGTELGRGCIALHDEIAPRELELGFYQYGAGLFLDTGVFEFWAPTVSVRQPSGSTSRAVFMVRDAEDVNAISMSHDKTDGIINTTDNYPAGGIRIRPSDDDTWKFEDSTTTGDLSSNGGYGGNLVINKAGKGIKIKEGSNARMGVANLSGGTVTVANTSVTANTRVVLTRQVSAGTPGHLSLGTVTPTTNFVINSSSGADTSTILWILFEPS